MRELLRKPQPTKSKSKSEPSDREPIVVTRFDRVALVGRHRETKREVTFLVRLTETEKSVLEAVAESMGGLSSAVAIRVLFWEEAKERGLIRYETEEEESARRARKKKR